MSSETMATNGMDTLGSQLEEARKKKGVSIREASEATKIRMEYLSQFEGDDFDLPLPPIYQRGFLKIYARYLGEDPAWYAAEIQARVNRKQAIQTKNDVRASLGQMDLASRGRRNSPESIAESSAADPSAETGKKGFKMPRIKMPGLSSGGPAEPEYDDFEETGEPLDRSFYLKVAVIVGSVTVAVVLMIALLKLILGGDEETALNPDLEGGSPAAEVIDVSGGGSPASASEIVLRATDGVTWVQVKDVATGEVLAQLRLGSGQSQTVSVEGAVVVQFTQGEFLEVERGGDVFAPTRSGAGKFTIE